MNTKQIKPSTLTASILGLSLGMLATAPGREYHVSPQGDDAHDGSAARTLQTISAAAARAQAGDVVTVHAGIYRERIDPPRGGTSDAERIVYRAAPGEKVTIKGSEILGGWKKVEHDTWQATVKNSVFGDFNPYADEIKGDWFNPLGRKHHTGAVYHNGHWLIEAARREDVLKPVGAAAASYGLDTQSHLLNVAWLQVGTDESKRIPADQFTAHEGIKTADCSEGGKCIGWINSGDWVRYEGVDFGEGLASVRIRVASASTGGVIEYRLGSADGKLLGRQEVSNTGGWQSWSTGGLRIEPLRGKQTLCLRFTKDDSQSDAAAAGLWFATVDDEHTTILAQFKDADPNQDQVEINARQSVFYPSKPGRNFITVRGFTMEHAATNWAPPTAEQVGLIGTHWSKGWIIEENTIRYSTCTGLTLGKHGDEFDNTSANSATGYVETIKRGLAAGWSKENIGHHLVRKNHISHCEQAGIVGSLGPVFCTVTGNVIHDIHVRQLFTGAEMGGIKFHAPIDTLISDNHIYRTCRGIWLDWMTQGTRVTRNLVHDTSAYEDLFVEVNHGPFLVDHNLFLSGNCMKDWSEGGAYAHNIFAGTIIMRPEPNRETPWQVEHGTEIAGLKNIQGGDNRFYNNIFVGPAGLDGYDKSALPDHFGGNLFLKGAKPSRHEQKPITRQGIDPGIRLVEKKDGWHLEVKEEWGKWSTRFFVSSDMLGKAAVTGQAYVRPDGSDYRLDRDYHGIRRHEGTLIPGPFATPLWDGDSIQVWPPEQSK